MIIECRPDMAEALKVILRHEEVPFTAGLGPGYIAIEVQQDLIQPVLLHLQEWKRAVDALVAETERVSTTQTINSKETY